MKHKINEVIQRWNCMIINWDFNGPRRKDHNFQKKKEWFF
jgi:hypothetical protein